MVKQKQSKEMLDYIVSNLAGCGEKIVPTQKKLVDEINSNYILVGDKGIVLLVDKLYPNGAYDKLYRIARNEKQKVATVFYKDGTLFFRSAAEDNHFKKTKDLSLKYYSNDDMNKMILLRPEEISIVNRSKRVQYYQPKSENLEQGIDMFSFKPVTFDYSHIHSDRFQPSNSDSKRLYLWTMRSHNGGDLDLFENGYLLPRKKVEVKPEVKPEESDSLCNSVLIQFNN